jgi:glutaredoxin
MPKVKIFSTSWCAYCRAEMRFLDEHKIPYEHVDVEADPKEAMAMINLSHQQGVPVTLITQDDNTQVYRVGFDQPWLEQQLGIA